MSDTAKSVTATVVTVSAAVALLVVGKSLLLPFAVAIIVWYIIDALSDSLSQIEVNGYAIFSRVSLFLSITIILFLSI